MASKRFKSYTAAFKLRVILKAESIGNRPAAREYSINERCIRRWRSEKSILEKMPKMKKARRGGAPRCADSDVNFKQTESQASSSTSDYQLNPEAISPNIDVKPGTSSAIIIKQEIFEAEEEESPSFFYGASSIAAEGLPSYDCPTNVSGSSTVFHAQETLPTFMSCSRKESENDHLRSNPNKSTQTSKTVSTNESRDQYDLFGELIASELRSMDADTSAIVRKVISELVYEVKVGKLLTNEEKTNLALKASDLINRINSANNNEQMILSDVNEQAAAASDVAMEESSNIVSESPSDAPEKSLEIKSASVTLAAGYPQETKPTILNSLENVAKSDGQKSTEQQSEPMDSKTCVPAMDSRENDIAELNSNSQLNSTSETAHISKIVRIDQYFDVGSVRTRDQRDIFGEFIIIELKKMDTITNSIVQKLISELIFEANVGIRLGDKEKTNLATKSCFFIARLHSVDKSLSDKTNSSVDKINQNHTSHQHST